MFSFVKWIVFLPLTIIMYIVGQFAAPILPAFASDDGWLPNWLSWFQTPDNSIDGDRGHRKRWPRETPFWRYVRRVAWLQRNCCYGFDDSVIGIHTQPTDVLYEVGETEASDRKGISGTCWRTLYRDDKLVAWHLYHVYHYKICRFKACIRISLGWKLWNPETVDKQYTCYFHPAKCFRIGE